MLPGYASIKGMLREVTSRTVPLRLLHSLGINMKLIDPLVLTSAGVGERCVLLHSIGYLQAEASEVAMDALLTLRENFVRAFRDGGERFRSLLSSCYTAAYALFHISLNIEPFSGHHVMISHGVRPADLIEDVSAAAKGLIEGIEGMGSVFERTYVRLHLSRTLAELGRLAYSMPASADVIAGHLCPSGSGGDVTECLLGLARDLINGSEEGVAELGYIQIASTETRTARAFRRDIRKEVEKELDRAASVLKELGIKDLASYDALSLVGSYHYNHGWFIANEYIESRNPRKYFSASNEFLEAAKSFLTVEAGDGSAELGYVRGAYVSLWNYFLMRLSGEVAEGGVEGLKDSGTVADAIDWGSLISEAFLTSKYDEALPHLTMKTGIHGWYSHLLAQALKLAILGEGIGDDDMTIVNEAYPPRLRSVLAAIKRLAAGDVAGAREELAKHHSPSSWPMKYITAIEKKEVGRLRPPTVRELPLHETLIKSVEEGDTSTATRTLALILVYTL